MYGIIVEIIMDYYVDNKLQILKFLLEFDTLISCQLKVKEFEFKIFKEMITLSEQLDVEIFIGVL